MSGEHTSWTETRIEWQHNQETTVYEDGHWTAEDKITMTLQRCGSPKGEPETPS